MKGQKTAKNMNDSIGQVKEIKRFIKFKLIFKGILYMSSNPISFWYQNKRAETS
jgi:hypothetical protein